MLPAISQRSFSAIRKALEYCSYCDRHLLKSFFEVLFSSLVPLGSRVAEANEAVNTTRLVNYLRPNQNALSPSKALFLKNHNR